MHPEHVAWIDRVISATFYACTTTVPHAEKIPIFMHPIPLTHQFADRLPELSHPWRAEPCPSPQLVVLNESLAHELDLDADWLASADGIRWLTGSNLDADTQPVAQAYSGHQFGGFSPLLGDGRALLLGELSTPSGPVDVHLKGSGPTPFSRAGADGRAALGPMLRELIVSEAMYALGVPTSRSLAVLTTGRPVFRHGREAGAVLVRTAASHLRVGSFQFAGARGDRALLQRLADYAIERHYPELATADSPYLALLHAVITAQAHTVAKWMLTGFIHGVMNTDNMTISGETLDYGPCAFMDGYDPATVFSSIDTEGRYAYNRQPAMAEWNLARFAETLLPLLDDDTNRAVELAQATLAEFADQYEQQFFAGMREKLGLVASPDEFSGRSDTQEAIFASCDANLPLNSLTAQLLQLMERHRLDFTNTFRALTAAAAGDRKPIDTLLPDDGADFAAWLQRWADLKPDAALMRRVNPVVIPRNHAVERALDEAAAGDAAELFALLEAVTDPFTERADRERFKQPASADFARYYRTFCGT